MSPTEITLLRIAYLLDLLVSLPLGWAMAVGNESVLRWLLRDDLPRSQSVRTSLGSLWLAIGVCLALGIAFPISMAPVLFLQLIYKSVWLLACAISGWLAASRQPVPWKVAAIYLLYVLVYPWVIPWSRLFTGV